MNKNVVSVQFDGVEVAVETSETRSPGSEPTSIKGEAARRTAVEAFNGAQEAILAVARSTVSLMGRMGAQAAGPDEVEVRFGVKFSSEGGVMIAKAGAEASLEVKLVYRRAPVTADDHE